MTEVLRALGCEEVPPGAHGNAEELGSYWTLKRIGWYVWEDHLERQRPMDMVLVSAECYAFLREQDFYKFILQDSHNLSEPFVSLRVEGGHSAETWKAFEVTAPTETEAWSAVVLRVGGKA